MPFELKTEFETLETAISYLKGDVLTELQRLQTVESEAEAEKTRIIANRDELRSEKKTLQDKLTTAETALTQAQTDLAEAKKGATEATDLEAKFVQMREQLEADYTQKIEVIQSEREAEKQQAAAARLKANAMAELSKPEYNLINADHFWKLHGDRLRLDDQGGLYVDRSDLGEFKQQTPAQYVEDIAQQPSEQHLFKPKGGRGNDSPGSADGPGTTSANPWKKESFNLTQQTILLRTNPGLAQRLKAEAGH